MRRWYDPNFYVKYFHLFTLIEWGLIFANRLKKIYETVDIINQRISRFNSTYTFTSVT